MAQYVYYTATGALYSWTPSDTDPIANAATLSAQGMASVSGLPALDGTHVWDTATKTVDTVAAAPATKPMSVLQFLQRFTPAEIALLQATTDVNIQYFIFLLPLYGATMVDIKSTGLVNAVNLMVTDGILTQPRANVILT